MKQITIEIADEDATRELGNALAKILPGGTTVALDGPLGAGKTRLVQAIAAAVGVAPGAAVSPTFVLVQEYHGARTIIHVDAYRLRDGRARAGRMGRARGRRFAARPCACRNPRDRGIVAPLADLGGRNGLRSGDRRACGMGPRPTTVSGSLDAGAHPAGRADESLIPP
jgi:hypothetical protein